MKDPINEAAIKVATEMGAALILAEERGYQRGWQERGESDGGGVPTHTPRPTPLPSTLSAGVACSCPYPNPKPGDEHRGCPLHGEPSFPGPTIDTMPENVEMPDGSRRPTKPTRREREAEATVDAGSDPFAHRCSCGENTGLLCAVHPDVGEDKHVCPLPELPSGSFVAQRPDWECFCGRAFRHVITSFGVTYWTEVRGPDMEVSSAEVDGSEAALTRRNAPASGSFICGSCHPFPCPCACHEAKDCP